MIAGTEMPARLPLHSQWPVWVSAFLAVAVGIAVAFGGAPGYAVAGLIALPALVVVVGRLGFGALLFWAAADAVFAPFLRIPTARAIITFDRVWLLGCLGVLLFTRRSTPMSRQTRLFLVALVAFGLEYGLNAVYTFATGGDITAPTIFVDSYFLAVIAFVVTLWLVQDRSLLRMLMVALVAGCAINSAIGIAELVFDFSFAANYNTTVRRIFETVIWISGGFEAPEEFTIALLVGEAAALYLLQTATGTTTRLLLAAATLLILVGLALVFFRTAWAAAVLVAIVSLAFRPRKRRPAFWFGTGLVALAAIILLQSNGGPDPSTASAALQRHTFGAESLYSRLATYEQGIDLFRGHPFFGVGVQQYQQVAINSPVEIVGGFASVPQAHDSLIGVLAEQGIVGFALFIAVLVAAYGLLRKALLSFRDPVDVTFVACATGAATGYVLMSITFQVLPMSPSNSFVLIIVGAVAGLLDLHEQGEQSVPRTQDAALHALAQAAPP